MAGFAVRALQVGILAIVRSYKKELVRKGLMAQVAAARVSSLAEQAEVGKVKLAVRSVTQTLSENVAPSRSGNR